MSVEPLLRVHEVTVTFGSLVALGGVSVDVMAGECLGLVGESGSGKSTLARVLVGLQEVSAGALVRHPDLSMRPPASRVQLVAQDPYTALNPHQRAWQTVAEVFGVVGRLGRRERRERAFALLEDLGLTEQQAQRLPASLSGGQRQRVSLARALAANPLVLVADEPTSALDLSAQAQVLALMKELRHHRQLTCVFVSHDLGVIRHIADRVAVLRHGELVEIGPTRRVMDEPSSDYTRLLLDSAPRRSARTDAGPGHATSGTPCRCSGAVIHP